MFIPAPPSSGPSTSSQPAQQQTSSQPSSADSSSLLSPLLSPQISPGPQLSDAPSDSPPVEGGSPAIGSALHCDPQGSSTGGGEEEEATKVTGAKEAKSHKKQQFHCLTCKVTVNSSSQLEAHCSGVYDTITMTSIIVHVFYDDVHNFDICSPSLFAWIRLEAQTHARWTQQRSVTTQGQDGVVAQARLSN